MKKYYMPIGDWALNEEPYRELMNRLGLEIGTDKNSEVLVLPGGADIGMIQDRDLREFRLYQEWTMAKKPVLGICRGMQVMLYLNEGELIEHIPAVIEESIHTTFTGDWLGQSAWHKTSLGLLTNSRHHQGYTRVPDYWEVVDATDDGIIEAVKYKNQFGVQWHPEYPEMNDTIAQEWWLETAKKIIG
jgi:gamma-glutamyl-gamma-aminobutyrate hydrolase PuuD